MENDAVAKPSVGPFTVILVEKDLMSRMTLAAILSCDGYRVFQAENPNAAVSCIDSIKDFDVLFADFNIPECNSLVRHATKTVPGVVVIAMAETDAMPENSALMRYGIEACVQKPIIYDDVRQVLSSTLERLRGSWGQGFDHPSWRVSDSRLKSAQ